MSEYKFFRIIYDTTLEEELIRVLEESGIEEYTIFPSIKGSWEKSKKHLDSHIWPGTDSLLSIILEKDACEELLKKYMQKKEAMDNYITFKIIITPVDVYLK